MGQSGSNQNGYNCHRTTRPSTTTTFRRRSFRSPFFRRKKHKHPLSATFQAPCSSNFEALNINTATVEQFMTLPGIDRRTAQSIIDHRTAVGGIFQRVDDLALVSGIGAEKLEQIRREICIKRSTRSNQGSLISSRTPSLDSILSESNSSMLPSVHYKNRLNVNTSTVFQLQQLPGMNQELAANLIDYRNRKGPFKSLDQLIKVKGISHGRLGAIRSLLCIQEDELTTSPEQKLPSKTANGFGNSRHRKSTSMPNKMCLELANGFINAPVNDIFDLLGAYSHRPVIKDEFAYERNGRPAIRIASWNMDRMCMEKSCNLGVREVVCRTILENCLSILCFQEIYETAALENICNELNDPKLRRCIEWKDNSRKWNYATNITDNENIILNGLGLIYDSSLCTFLSNESFDIQLNCCAKEETYNIAPSAYLATFQFGDWKCRILNVFLRYYDLKCLNEIIFTIQTSLQNNSNKLNLSDIFMVVGDFTGLNNDNAEANNNSTLTATDLSNTSLSINLENLGFYSTFGPYATSFSTEQTYKTNSDAVSSCNILCRERMPSTKSAFREAIYRTKTPLSIYNHEVPFDGEKLCGYYGIVHDGLCHMAIPRCWTWGGPASEHLPIWVEVYKNIDHTSKSDLKTTPEPISVQTDGMRRRTIRRNSFNSCHLIEMPFTDNKSKQLNRGMTFSNISSPSNTTNGDGNIVFYDANECLNQMNQREGSYNSSSDNLPSVSNGK